MDCKAKHVKLEVPTDDFCCPKCGVSTETLDGDGFWIDTPDEDAAEGCMLMHEKDFLMCYKCGYETTGKDFSKLYAKKLDMVPCPCCKGTGYVKKGRE